ncbi:AfsR/SARP family transcriptional regulator [Micromonospora sp. WMMD558]|uniref:AfsR/SARP family transcriptional regulator n=1 Tax=unclassified Micromonospora TaxID=2617518 RepID=UPI0012B4800D|nr:BTAD domain-containing putative transcriptional regulator [Micromonospora sp. WMMC415]QGN46198.1 tetratricopeptide repeat protein [Micromonospora sp. WMMC415]
MEIHVLGGLSVRVSSGDVHLGTPKQQTVLAMLVTAPEHLVTIDELVDEVWGAQPPRSAVPNVRTYAANLRRTLQGLDSAGALIVRKGDAYRLHLGRCELDLIRFTAECEEAQALIGRHDRESAANLLARAVRRWRSRMLAGVPLGPILSARVAAAEEQRLRATELLAQLWIELQRHEQAVPALREVLVRDPLRESTHALLVRALHLRGDRAAALDAYEAARTVLEEQLGVVPGAELQRVRELLRDPPAAGRRVPPAIGVPGPVNPVGGVSGERVDASPNWLPRPVPQFIGRGETVNRLLAETSRIEKQMSPVHVIDGMAGSGKTTTAVHAARLLAPRYPDAALFIDLRGHEGSGAIDATAAMGVLLRQLGVPAGRIPSDRDLRVELWRRELAGRRSIVVLDNAASADQVAPLLPVTPGTLVIVTSRRRLFGLDAGPPHSLPVLSTEEGLALLEATAGAARMAGQAEAAATVVRQCGHLPLAIRLAGSRLANRPAWRVSHLAQLLQDSAGRLGHLAAKDRSVAGAFATSYELLEPSAKRLFRLLSQHPGGDLSLPMAAALAGLPADITELALDELVDLHLVEEIAARRYRMHDLIRQYSQELSQRDDTGQERDRALSDLLDFVLHTTLRAALTVEPKFLRRQVALDTPRRPDLVQVPDAPTTEWLEAERSNLVSLVATARRRGLYGQTWRLARVLWRFLYIRAYFDDIITTHAHGLAAARVLGDKRATAMMHNYLASAHLRMSEYGSCLEHLAAAVEIAEELGDRPSIDRYRANMVAVYWIRGDLAEAVEVGYRGLRTRRYLESDEVPSFLPNIGLALTALGRYDEALRMHRTHLFHARQNRNYFHILNALGHIGSVKSRMGRHVEGIRLMSAALALRDRTGHRYAEPEVRNDIGVALRHLGHLDEAVEQHELAAKLAVDSGERHVEAAVLNDLALTLAQAGRTERPVDLHRAALRIATRIAHPYEQGRALAGLAEQALAEDAAEARRYWERALAIFRRMGVPERFEVERRLAELPSRRNPLTC